MDYGFPLYIFFLSLFETWNDGVIYLFLTGGETTMSSTQKSPAVAASTRQDIYAGTFLLIIVFEFYFTRSTVKLRMKLYVYFAYITWQV